MNAAGTYRKSVAQLRVRHDRRIKSGDDASLLSSAHTCNPIWTCNQSSPTFRQSGNADPNVDRRNDRDIREESR
jgi:hypothetical protein